MEHFGQNQKTCSFTFMRFLVEALPEVKNQFLKPFSNKVLYSYYSKKILSISVRTRKPALSLSCVFWLGYFPRSKISSESSFLIKCFIITDLNFFLESFRQNQKHALSLSCIFRLGHFPRSNISFLIKCYIITDLKKNWSVSIRTRKPALSRIFWLGHSPR